MSADGPMEIEATTSQTPETGQFDPDRFPFDAQTRAAIVQRREQLDGLLFFDIILGAAGAAEAIPLFPPKNMDEFEQFRDVYLRGAGDSLRRACVTFYLLKWWDTKGAARLRRSFPIPSQFSLLTEAYFHLDTGMLKDAICQLADSRIPPNHSSKVLRTLEAAGDYESVLFYVQGSRPVLLEQWEIDLHAVALSKSTLRSAWSYQRSFPAVNRRHLIEKIVQHALIPKPSPRTLEQLLVFPFDDFEQEIVQSLATDPPQSFTEPDATHALPILQDLVITRLITSGQFSEAAKLNASFPAPIGEEARSKAVSRQDSLSEIIQGLSALMRAEVEQELKGHGIDPFAPKPSQRDTPRKPKPKPILPLFTPAASTSSLPTSSAATPTRTPVPSTPRPPLDIPIIPPINSNGRFNTPPPTGTVTYIRSQGAPSPASPAAFAKLVPPTANGQASPISVQKTKNAFFDPSSAGPKQSLFGDLGGSGGRKRESLSSSGRTGSGFGGPLRGRSSLSKVLANHSRGASTDEELVGGDGDEADELDSFVRNGGRREFLNARQSEILEQQEEEDTPTILPPDPLDSFPDTDIRLRPDSPPLVHSTITSPKRRRGVKRAASSQLLPGAFPHDAVVHVENPPESEGGDRNQAPLPALSTSAPRKRSRGKQSRTEQSPEMENPTVPGGFSTIDEDETESMRFGEERDTLPALPSQSLNKKGRRKRAASVESDASDLSTASQVRRSTRLSHSATLSDTESRGPGSGPTAEKKKPSSRASTRSARSKRA